MAPEATTEPHASSLPASIDSLRAVPDLGRYGPDDKTVDALERFQRACNYLAAAMIFLKRVGGIILALTVLLWFFSTFPGPPEGATGPAIQYSLAGMIGRALEVIFAPIGFNWQISIALVPGLAAREVAVGALGTVYAMSATGDDAAAQLEPVIAASWSTATAVSLLVWYVFAPMCLSTLATVKRETNSWRYAALMAGYLFALAYGCSFIAYRITLALS